eukprot:s2578_g3.t1
MRICLTFWFLAPCSAIQLPLAELFVPSAASSDDCEIRSGANEPVFDFEAAPAPCESCRSSFWNGGFRYGEASHPGPYQDLVIGTTNPSGLRSKEALAVGQGPGIWCYSETQLSAFTQSSAARALKRAALDDNRWLRPYFSAPAPLRSRSNWAGSWSGVLITSDFVSQQLCIDWPPDMWQTGRMVATLHQVGRHQITVVALYGFPRGPTWPMAKQHMGEILDFLTRTFVLGHSGLIAICGDFNFSPFELEQFHHWRAAGWHCAQDYAALKWNQTWQPTCKGATERDLIWMSPALTSLCTAVRVDDVFQDHSSVSVTIALDEAPHQILTWPRPREIDWDIVDVAAWHNSCASSTIAESDDATTYLKHFSQHFEQSLAGYVGQSGGSLLPVQCGRAQRLVPEKQTLHPRSCRASRPGEVALQHDLVGTAVLQWFRQLRRIQSYLHAIKAGKMHLEAIIHRTELWTSIVRARGFSPNFPEWWDQRELLQAIGPFPSRPPDAVQAAAIYEAFLHEFRAFERWHLSHLAEMLVFKSWPDLQVGDELVMLTQTRTDADVHQKLIDLWRPRWQQLHAVNPDFWSRITGFIRSYMPRFDFSVSDITPQEWMKTVKRFKPTAARGADGFAKRDLLHMSPLHVSFLLRLLQQIELGHMDWPQQWLQGIVLALAKHCGAHEAGSYRPIVLLSIIYRCWSSLRSRQLLRMIEGHMHPDAYGFLPGREATQAWLQIQSNVELAVSSGCHLAGLAVDFIKAFNHIRRPQWFFLAEHLGLPDRILRPWAKFLESFTRRFQVHNHLSDPLLSDVGFAEGDPLSVPAMAILDWALHIYQSQYAPMTRTLSFVDNISIVSQMVANLLWAFFSLRSFLEL